MSGILPAVTSQIHLVQSSELQHQSTCNKDINVVLHGSPTQSYAKMFVSLLLTTAGVQCRTSCWLCFTGDTVRGHHLHGVGVWGH